MNLRAHFAVLKSGKVASSGRGTIKDLSRTGIFLKSRSAPPPGSVLRLEVAWPVVSEDTKRLDWIVDGIVVRSEPGAIAVRIMRQRFVREVQKTENRELAG